MEAEKGVTGYRKVHADLVDKSEKTAQVSGQIEREMKRWLEACGETGARERCWSRCHRPLLSLVEASMVAAVTWLRKILKVKACYASDRRSLPARKGQTMMRCYDATVVAGNATALVG